MEPSEESNLKEPIGRIMGNISRMFLANLHRQLGHLDIDRSYFPLLIIESGNGNLIQRDLAGILSCDKVQVVRIIDYLSSFGYVARGQNSKDRRKCYLELTEKARKSIPDIKKALQETTAIALNNVSENNIDEMYRMLKLIENNLATTNLN